jgi:hypothetical protein
MEDMNDDLKLLGNDVPDDNMPNDPINGPISDDLDMLFGAARQPTSADLGAADRFLAGFQAERRGRQRQALKLWASTGLGVAAAVTGLMFLRPAPAADLPASAAYSVYQSALGEGW